VASTLTTFTAFTKRVYTKAAVENLIGTDRPFLGMVQKTEDMEGESLTVPMITTVPQGIAGQSRATAQGNKTNVGGQKFVITLGEYFGNVDIGDKVLKATRSNFGAFLQNKKAEIDALYGNMADAMETYLWGNGGGSLGVISSISTDVITLTNPTDAYNFATNMSCTLSANDGSDSGHTQQAGVFTIAGVNPGAGTITGTAGEIAALTGESGGDYIFREGDFFGDTGTVVLQGLQKQLSGGVAPAALYGMTRTSDYARLAGCWVPAASLTGLNIEQRLQRLGTFMTGRFRSKAPTTWFLHPEDWEVLSFSLQSKGTRPLQDSSTKFGYEYLELISGGKRGKIYCASAAPKGIGWGLSMPNWWLGSLDKLIHVIEEDGLQILRNSTTDDYEYRLKSYPALWTNAPLYSGRVSLT
jgi:hypothetical protein